MLPATLGYSFTDLITLCCLEGGYGSSERTFCCFVQGIGNDEKNHDTLEPGR